jgi:hypothetical protein
MNTMTSSFENDDPASEFADPPPGFDEQFLHFLQHRRGRSSDSRTGRLTQRFRLEFHPDDGSPAQLLAEGPDAEQSYLAWAEQLLLGAESGWLMLIDARTGGPLIRRHLLP